MSVKIASEISRIFPLRACKVYVVSKHVISPIAHIFDLFCSRYDDWHFVCNAHSTHCNSHDFFALFSQRRIAVFDVAYEYVFHSIRKHHRDFCCFGILHGVITVCKQISCRVVRVVVVYIFDNNTINRISRFILKRHNIIILLTGNNHIALFAVLVDNLN